MIARLVRLATGVMPAADLFSSIMSRSILAIIPARGGSKGVPGKNIRPLGGRPLIGHAIAAARSADSVVRVVVTTDDDGIASVAESFGADVVRRPAELSGDTASSESALLHALDAIEAEGHGLPEALAFVQCTSPFVAPADIEGTVAAMRNSAADCAFTATPFHHFLWSREADGNLAGINHDPAVRPMRQQREPQYLETGAVYVMKTAGFRAAGHRFFGKVAIHEVPAERTLEIDSLADFELAERMISSARRADAAARLPTTIGAVVFDFDGVMTDNRVFLLEDGREAVACNRGDGMGIAALRRAGVPMLVLSKERNPVVTARCEKLQVPCLQGVDEKPAALREWLGTRRIPLADTVYVGNDINDLECLRIVGCGVIVGDAHPGVHSVAQIRLDASGGHGAVRELTDLIIQKLESDSLA